MLDLLTVPSQATASVLQLVPDDSSANPILLQQLPVVIGRDPAATVQIDNLWISRTHCELYLEHGCIHIRDLGSSLGTLVNGEHIDDAELILGDSIAVGGTLFRFACSSIIS